MDADVCAAAIWPDDVPGVVSFLSVKEPGAALCPGVNACVGCVVRGWVDAVVSLSDGLSVVGAAGCALLFVGAALVLAGVTLPLVSEVLEVVCGRPLLLVVVCDDSAKKSRCAGFSLLGLGIAVLVFADDEWLDASCCVEVELSCCS